MTRLLWCAAAGDGIGLGHVMRGVPVAEVARPLRVTTELAVLGAPVPDLDLAAFGAVHSHESLRAALEIGPDIVVLDSYAIGPDELRTAGEEVAVVATFDDHGIGHFPVDVLIDIDDSDAGRTVSPRTVVLVGPRYALVRAELRRRRRPRPFEPGQPARVLVSFGGSDPAAVGPLVAAALDAAGHQVTLVHPPNADLAAVPSSVRLVTVGDGFGALVDGVDVVVGACGTTALEVAGMAQAAVVVSLADNQQALARLLDRAGAAVVVAGPGAVVEAVGALVASAEAHAACVAAAAALVDGRGAERVLAALLDRAGPSGARYRS